MLEASWKYRAILTVWSYLNLRLRKAQLDALPCQTWLVTWGLHCVEGWLVSFSLDTPFVGMVSFPQRTLPTPCLGGTSQTGEDRWPVSHHSVGGSSFYPSGLSSACPGFFCNWGEMVGIGVNSMQFPKCGKSGQSCGSPGATYSDCHSVICARPPITRTCNSWVYLGFYITEMLDPWLPFSLTHVSVFCVFYQISFHSSLCLTTLPLEVICFYGLIVLFLYWLSTCFLNFWETEPRTSNLDL